MSMQPLLVELGTEELPVKALPGLAQAFFDGVIAALERRGVYSGLASPRSKPMPRFSSAPTMPSKKAWARPGSALTGSSSVPSSTSRGFCSLMCMQP